MKVAAQCTLLLLYTCILSAQASPSPFPSQIKHVVIIFQENRTPDNLFQGLSPLCTTTVTSSCYDIQSFYTNPSGTQVPLAPVGLATNFDLSHSHSNFEFELNNPGVPVTPSCGANIFGCAATTWDQFMFVSNNPVTNSDGSSGTLLGPYLTFAQNFGWGNFMYQTNQGPSYPAHQFMFSGTSALSAANDTASTFVSENFSLESGGTGAVNSGCLAGPDAFSDILKPNPSGVCPTSCTCFNGGTVAECRTPNSLNMTTAIGTFCVLSASAGGHNSMATLLDNAAVTWKYYAPSAGSIWTAPNALDVICQPAFDSKGNLFCSGSEWASNVDVANLGTDILSDIDNCNLSQVSWVIPNGTWSDHANSNNGLGPSWVASVINDIGTSKCSSGNWLDTAIVVTWDDWGGWFDHVAPDVLSPAPPCTSTNCPGDYQYGFRVPLIVVSAYTPVGYINNSTHDFGSVLRMIEGVYGLGEGNLGFADARATNDLRDFFASTVQTATYTPVPSVKDKTFFLNQGQSGIAAVPPDDDDD